jgi:hypothetical protein
MAKQDDGTLYFWTKDESDAFKGKLNGWANQIKCRKSCHESLDDSLAARQGLVDATS